MAQTEDKTKAEQKSERKEANHDRFKRGENYEKLNLTDAQKTQVKTINDDFRKQMQDLHKQGNITVDEQKQKLEKQISQLSVTERVYAGNFKEPEPTRRFQRGDPMQPREAVAPCAPGRYRPESRESDRRIPAPKRETLASPRLKFRVAYFRFQVRQSTCNVELGT